jgi:RNA polymerase sigma-70 factor (ECF subfamily)
MKPDEAIRRAYVAHYPDLVRFLRHKLGSASEAADLAHESFARWLSFVRDSRGLVREPRAFLFHVARNLVQDAWRSRARRAMAVEDGRETGGAPPSVSPERAAEARQRLSLLARAVGELPPRCREAFELHKFHGLSHDEVAARMRISRNMVEKHVIRAMLLIRERIGPERSA